MQGFRGRERAGSRSISPTPLIEEVKTSLNENEVTDGMARHFETVFSKVDSEL